VSAFLIQVVEATTANGVCTLRIRAHPLPQGIATALSENETLIRRSLLSSSAEQGGKNPKQEPLPGGESDGGLPHTNGVASSGNGGRVALLHCLFWQWRYGWGVPTGCGRGRHFWGITWGFLLGEKFWTGSRVLGA
jgi:hypothetical protein